MSKGEQTWNVESGLLAADSHNDLPLLSHVDHPVAVDPDPRFRKEAFARGWPVITLR